MASQSYTAILKKLVVVLSGVYLSACGGGGSSSTSNNSSTSTTPTTANYAEGLYLESNTVRLQKVNFVVKDTVFFGITGQTDSAGQMLAADGVFAGLGSSSNGTYTANLNYFSSGVMPATLTASAAKLNTLSGTLVAGGVSQPLTADAPSSAAYTYAKAASLQDVLGDWTLNRTVKLTVDKTGLISGNDGGCSFSGLILPDAAKNVYVVSITDTKSVACGVTGGVEAKGYAVSYLLQNGKRQFLVMTQVAVMNAARGFAGVR